MSFHAAWLMSVHTDGPPLSPTIACRGRKERKNADRARCIQRLKVIILIQFYL